MEQIPLHLDDENEELKVNLESLPELELVNLYKDAVGVNPLFRGLSREELIAGINDSESEIARLREIDSTEDKDDLSSPYRR